MEKNDIIIETTDELKSLLKSYRIHLMPRTKSRIIIRLNEYSEQENYRLNLKINSYYYSCGCSEGALFMLGGFVMCVFYILSILKLNINLISIPAMIVFLFLFSTLGKFLGILIDRIRLGRLINKLSKC